MRVGLCILLAAILVAPARAADEVAVVVLPLDGSGVEAKVVDGVAALVEEEIGALDGFRALPVNARVSALLKKCRSPEIACLTRAADARGADLAVTGSVRRVDNQLDLHLRLLDVARASERHEAIEPLDDGDQGLRQGVHRAVLGLLVPERLTGSLAVTCNVDGARIRVDGSAVGTTPLTQPIEGVVEGRRTVQVDRLGYEPYEQVVEVRYRQEHAVQAALLRRTDVSPAQIQELQRADKPPGPWRPGLGPWSWVITGVGSAFIAGGIASGVMVLLQSAEVERRASGQVLVFPRDQALVEQGRLYSVLANTLYGLGLVAGATGTTLGVWDLLVPGPEPAPLPAARPSTAAAEVEEWDEGLTQPPEQRPASAPGPRNSEKAGAETPAVTEPAAEDEAPAALPDGDALPEGDA